MSWINTNGETSEGRPIRIRLFDNSTLTNDEVTDQALAENNWSWIDPPIDLSTSTNFIID